VFKASWHGTDVAVKVLKDDHLEMLLEYELFDDVEKARIEQQQQFEQEAMLLSTLRHPNIVNFLGFTVGGTNVSMALIVL
jgi:serine/threonine protein kinase